LIIFNDAVMKFTVIDKPVVIDVAVPGDRNVIKK